MGSYKKNNSCVFLHTIGLTYIMSFAKSTRGSPKSSILGKCIENFLRVQSVVLESSYITQPFACTGH